MRELGELKNIVLIGFMGTGKTSVGRRLAQVFNLPFVDADQEIEKLMGMSISDIFDKYGEIRFRSEESLVIRKLGNRRGIVLATGGGAILDPDNLVILKQNGVLVTLTATPEAIVKRTSRKSTRPLLKKDNSVEAIEKLQAARQFAYGQGDLFVDTTEKSLEEVTGTIVCLLKENGYGKGKS